MAGTWSGTFTGEDILATPYQAQNGVRGLLDASVVGATTINAPLSPEEDSSFSVWCNNPTREVITVVAVDTIQAPNGEVSFSIDIIARNFLVGFSFQNGLWHIDNWMPFVTPLGINEAAEWTPRTTNGPCTIIDSTPGISIDRTGLGFYTINFAGPVTSANIITFSPFVVGLAAENKAEVIEVTVGGMTMDINTGFRNKNGQFTDSDLLDDPGNTVSIFVQVIP